MALLFELFLRNIWAIAAVIHTINKFKKSYGGTPEPQTAQDAPWLRGHSLKKTLNILIRYDNNTIDFLTPMMMMMIMVLFCLSKRTPLLNGLGFSGTSY
jgi:hypothetical protein